MKAMIDAPGAGDWIMSRASGVFAEARDHAFSNHDDDGEILGGFALTSYLGGSYTVHMAGEGSRWCSRELMWLVFHYAFKQLGCYKLFAPVRSDSYEVVSMDLRAGWALEATLYDAYEKGVHMLVLSMTKDTCPWLGYTPRQYRDGRAA